MLKKIDTAGIAQLLGYSSTYVTDKVTKRPALSQAGDCTEPEAQVLG